MTGKTITRILCGIGTAALMLSLWGQAQVTAYANDDVSYSEDAVSFSGSIATLDEAADAYASPSESAQVVHSFAAGDNVFITGEDSGFKAVFFQGETLYIKGDVALKASAVDANSAVADEEIPLDTDEYDKALRAEFEQAALEDAAYAEAFLRQQEALKKALIWKIVIGALIAGLLVVSVIIGLKNKKNDETVNENS